MQTLASLQQALMRLPLPINSASARRATLGVAAADGVLGGGLACSSVHDVYAAAEADITAASGFALGLAMRFSRKEPLLWVREEMLDREAGELYPPGLAALGLDPRRLFLMRARHAEAALRAAGEAVRCAGLGAVLMTLWGQPRAFDLTASRRLLLAAEASGVPFLVIRTVADPMPSAAATRWSIRALPSRPLEANAPGFPRFAATLLRQRGGPSGHVWRLEWNHAQRCFAECGETPAAPALSRPVDAVPAGAGDARGRAAAQPLHRAG